MSQMSRGPVAIQESLPVPAVPTQVPSFCEAVPTGPRPGPHFGPTGPLSPPYRGDGGRTPTGATRKASLRTCRCHQPILVGLDADRCALAAACDPYPLTPAGEVWALRDGRWTYLLAGGQLQPRDRWNIPGHPPDDATRVLAEHRCGHPIPDERRAPPPPAPPRPAPATEGMPF